MGLVGPLPASSHRPTASFHSVCLNNLKCRWNNHRDHREVVKQLSALVAIRVYLSQLQSIYYSTTHSSRASATSSSDTPDQAIDRHIKLPFDGQRCTHPEQAISLTQSTGLYKMSFAKDSLSHRYSRRTMPILPRKTTEMSIYRGLNYQLSHRRGR